MPRWTLLTVPLAALVLGACSTPPEQITSGPEPGSTSEPSTTATPTSTPPGEDTVVATMGGSGMDTTTMGVDATTDPDTTVGMATTDGTTMGVDPTSSSSGPPPECMNDEQCENNETCNGMGECAPACEPWGGGHYDYCITPLGTFNSTELCGEAESCIVDDNPYDFAVCGLTCGSLCECPGPPATGNATVTCGAIAGDTRCFLSCQNGEECPDGMVCLGNYYCSNPVQPLAMYGNCDDVNAPCADGGTCATFGSHSVCVSLCPGGIEDCDPAPSGPGMGEHCDGVIAPPDGADCHLDCDGGCPPGMDCINTGLPMHSTLCMWP